MQASKALDLEESIKKDIESAVQHRCGCDFNSSAIYSGEFSCQTTTTEVIYRAIINGTSDLHTAAEVFSYIENWLKIEGTLLYNKIRLRLAKNCSLYVETFSEVECKGDGDPDESGRDVGSLGHGKGGLLLGSDTCYRFQSCSDVLNTQNGSGNDDVDESAKT